MLDVNYISVKLEENVYYFHYVLLLNFSGIPYVKSLEISRFLVRYYYSSYLAMFSSVLKGPNYIFFFLCH